MIDQFREMVRLYEKLNAIDITVLTDEEIHAQNERLNGFSILINDFNDFTHQLESVDTSIENREQITSLLIDVYAMIEKVSWHIAHMTDFCRDANGKYWREYEQYNDNKDE